MLVEFKRGAKANAVNLGSSSAARFGELHLDRSKNL
jgi:hypothetical protein